jgi:hypothetical protein
MLLDAIKTIIERQIQLHPQIEPWLADWCADWETQINIDTTGLEPCYGKGWDKPPTHWVDDDGVEHRQIRIPHGAMTTTPHFRDRPVNGPIHERWALLGTSGWNWAAQKSMWVGFDFDSVANHAGGLNPATLAEIRDRVLELPYSVLRTSKSGAGYHVLVPLNPWITTRSHVEHAALAQDVLSRMSSDCDFDFHGSADCCGLILWHWQRGLGEDGLQRIKRTSN